MVLDKICEYSSSSNALHQHGLQGFRVIDRGMHRLSQYKTYTVQPHNVFDKFQNRGPLSPFISSSTEVAQPIFDELEMHRNDGQAARSMLEKERMVVS